MRRDVLMWLLADAPSQPHGGLTLSAAEERPKRASARTLNECARVDDLERPMTNRPKPPNERAADHLSGSERPPRWSPEEYPLVRAAKGDAHQPFRGDRADARRPGWIGARLCECHGRTVCADSKACRVRSIPRACAASSTRDQRWRGMRRRTFITRAWSAPRFNPRSEAKAAVVGHRPIMVITLVPVSVMALGSLQT
jgi:hypothetical protein